MGFNSGFKGLNIGLGLGSWYVDGTVTINWLTGKMSFLCI